MNRYELLQWIGWRIVKLSEWLEDIGIHLVKYKETHVWTPQQRAKRLDFIFMTDEWPHFRYGFKSKFASETTQFVEMYGTEALSLITNKISDKDTNTECSWEALKWLGDMEHPTTHVARRDVLESMLQHDSVYVRDGALLGLSHMDDPLSIPAIRLAIARVAKQDTPSQKVEIRQVLEQLENTLAQRRARA